MRMQEHYKHEGKRIAVAMSGGVDSSVAAALLKKGGAEVFGITMRTMTGCRDAEDGHILAARRVAESMGIELHVVDCSGSFEKLVIRDFIDSYGRGETPAPCVRCNRLVKFGELFDAAVHLGAEGMATGHYARITKPDNGAPELRRGSDDIKDQSYFLFAIRPEILGRLHFPLGGMTKPEVRDLAASLDLPVASRPESQDICFIPDGDYTAFIRRQSPGSMVPGDIVHMDGRVLGRHEGIANYTTGQRKGLGIGGGHTENNTPLYVVALDPVGNRVIAGPKEALACSGLILRGCNWLVPPKKSGSKVEVKFRSVMKPVPARLYTEENGGAAEIAFEEKQYGVAPGQAAVCYKGDMVLGGGWIERCANDARMT